MFLSVSKITYPTKKLSQVNAAPPRLNSLVLGRTNDRFTTRSGRLSSSEGMPERPAGLRTPVCRASLADRVDELLEAARVPKKTRDHCRHEVVLELLAAEQTLNAAGRRAEEAGRRAEEAGRRAENTSQKLVAVGEKLAEAQVAAEVAKARTMDVMRERGMVHARGVLEVAELYERPLHPQAAKGRTALWQAILRERPVLAACLHARAGWAPHQAPREIEALYRNLKLTDASNGSASRSRAQRRRAATAGRRG